MKIFINIMTFLTMFFASASAMENTNPLSSDTVTACNPEDEWSKPLPYPYTGNAYIVEHFGENEALDLQEHKKSNKGVVFKTEEGSMARSVSDGIVSAVFVYAGKYSVIIRHGEYLSVYSGLENVTVKRDQEVSALHPIGNVCEERLLSFQWRKGKNPINPENFFSR